MARILSLIALLLGAGPGCGARSDLEQEPPRDGGTDASIDGGADFEVLCGRRDRYSSPRRPITLTAATRSTAPIASEGWRLVTSPPTSTSVPSPTTGPSTTLVPDLSGDYVLLFTAQDTAGRAASCEVVVHSVVGPPVAICPEEEELLTPADRTLEVVGDGYDDEMVVRYLWEIAEAPPGSSPLLLPATEPVTSFISDLPGRYRLRLTVWDLDGATSSCDQLVRVTAPPVLDCPAEEIVARTRVETVIRVGATDDVGIASMRWTVVDRPPTSTAEPRPADREVTRLTPDREGLYLLLFTATDSEGMSASCEVRVRALPTPPDAICPPEVVTTPMTTIELVGDGVDDGRVVAYRWELAGRPAASSADPPAPANMRTTRFTPDVAGEYVLRLTVVDDHGETDTCDVRVRAVPDEGLRVEVFWNPPDTSCDTVGGPMCDDTDVDVHLLRPGTEPWFDSRGDCYYANCNSASGHVLEWGAPGPEDNPRLDLDDVEGFGPENINIDRPQAGTYRIGVHLFDGASRGRASVTVNVYCGERTTPDRTFGPVLLTARSGPDANPFWRVADVEIGAARCRLTDLSVGGLPNITTKREAESAR